MVRHTWDIVGWHSGTTKTAPSSEQSQRLNGTMMTDLQPISHYALESHDCPCKLPPQVTETAPSLSSSRRQDRTGQDRTYTERACPCTGRACTDRQTAQAVMHTSCSHLFQIVVRLVRQLEVASSWQLGEVLHGSKLSFSELSTARHGTRQTNMMQPGAVALAQRP